MLELFSGVQRLQEGLGKPLRILRVSLFLTSVSRFNKGRKTAGPVEHDPGSQATLHIHYIVAWNSTIIYIDYYDKSVLHNTNGYVRCTPINTDDHCIHGDNSPVVMDIESLVEG